MDPGNAATSSLPHRPPPTAAMTEKRSRRRAREVSSRYMMTPSSSSSSSSSSNAAAESPSASPRFGCAPPSSVFAFPLHSQPRRTPSSSPDAVAVSDSELDHSSFSSSRYADENQPLGSSSSVRRSLETPLSMSSMQGKFMPGSQAKKRTVVRLFADQPGPDQHHPPPLPPSEQLPLPNSKTMMIDLKRRPRPPAGTPMPFPVDRDRTATHNSSATPRSTLRPVKLASARKVNLRPLTPARQNFFASEDANGNNDELEEAFPDNSSTIVDCSDLENCSVSSQGELCDSPPLPCASSRLRPAIDLRSSMPTADHLPTLTARRVIEGGASSRKDGAEDSSACRSSTNSMCFRSLNTALSSSQQFPPLNLSKFVNRPFVSSKPPQPPNAIKLGSESKKGKKALIQQDDVHMLRLLDNCYVQWRFINAKAGAAVESRTIAAERSLKGLQIKTSQLQTSRSEKMIELEQLKRQQRLFSIVNNQIPYLDDWTILEEDYSACLAGTTRALQDASVRLPIVGNVKADVKEINEVVNSVTLILDSLAACVGSFLNNVEVIEDGASDLANLVSKERSLVEECGYLLSVAHSLQVKECSLRSQLLQLKEEQ